MAKDNRPLRARARAGTLKRFRRMKNRGAWAAKRPVEMAELKRLAKQRRAMRRRSNR